MISLHQKQDLGNRKQLLDLFDCSPCTLFLGGGGNCPISPPIKKKMVRPLPNPFSVQLIFSFFVSTNIYFHNYYVFMC